MKKPLILVGMFFFLSTISYLLLSYEKEDKIQQHLQNKTRQYMQNYKVLYEEHKTLSDVIFITKINIPEVINIFKDANLGTREQKDKVREDLHKYLKETYSLLKKINIKQLHFHLPNNDSFLRFHRPKIFGDNLTDVRATIKYVNEHKKPIDGFEEGRIYNGYRFVFPMFYNNQHIGSVEVSFSTFEMNLEFMHDYDVKSSFLILKSVVEKKIFKDEGVNYTDSLIKDFSLEKDMLKHIEEAKNIKVKEPISQKTRDIISSRAHDPHSFSLYDPIRRDIMTFIKVQNPISKKVVGIFVVRSSAEYIFNKIKNFYLLLLLVNLFIAVILFFLYKEIRYRNYIELSNKKLQESRQEILLFNQTLEDKVKQRTDEQNTMLSLFDRGDSVLFKWKNNEKWSVEFASLGVSELLGYSLVDIMTNKITYTSCIHEDDLERVLAEVGKASLARESYFKHKPYRIITKDGTIKWVLDYTIIVTDEDNNITHYIGHISNITEQKNIEKQLLQQSRMAQMGEMISMIAHQWRQPLGAISATSIDLSMKLELEMFDMKTQEGRERTEVYFINSLKHIDKMVQSLTTTIDDFRNFYKPDKDEEVSIVNLPVKKACEIFETSLKSNSIEIVQEYISQKKLTLYCNEFMQVIVNILQNMQDNFLEKNTYKPLIKIKTFDTSKSSIIEISDNGGGIPIDIIDKVFDPYFSTKNKRNGTGLGLYMSKIIVEEHHHGKLSVKNINDGVCFTIEINNNNN